MVLWRGAVGTQTQWIEFSAASDEQRILMLTLQSDADPVRENGNPDARALGFAVYGVEVRRRD